MKRVIRWVAAMLFLALWGTASVSAAPVKIDFWHGQKKDYQVESWEQLVREFNASQDEVEVSVVPGKRGDELVVAMSAGTAPVVTFQGTAEVGNFYAGGLIAPMEGGLERFGMLDTLSKDVMPHLWDSVNYEGHILGIPYNTNYYAPMYNLRILNEFGLDQPPAGWTPDEFISYAQKLYAPPASRPVESPHQNVTYATWYVSAAGDQSHFDPMTYETALKSPESRRVLDFIDELYNRRDLVRRGGSEGSFSDGTLPLHLGVSIGGFANWPVGRDEPENVQMATPVDFGHGPRGASGGWALMLMNNQTPEETAAAWKFINWLLKPEIQMRHIATGGLLPTRRSVVQTDVWRDYVASRPYMIQSVEGVMKYGAGIPAVPRAPQAYTVMGAETKKLMDGEITIEQWIENATAGIRAAYSN